MAKHFVIFIHGVNTREKRERPEYANNLCRLISAKLGATAQQTYFIPLYWGDVNKQAENELEKRLETSDIWNHMYMRDLRMNQVMQFVGDAALYISRDIGSLVVDTIADQAINGSEALAFEGLKNADPRQPNYIHLVTHSWGTIILFDVLFASRWDDPQIPGHGSVQTIRNTLFGVGANPDVGLYLGSITTMGSPISIFSLMSQKLVLTQPASPVNSTHDVSSNLSIMLEALGRRMGGENYKLSWTNHVHPGDLVAWPIQNLMDTLVPNFGSYVGIEDSLVEDAGPLRIFEVFTPTALWGAGDAHASYWQSHKVADSITQKIIDIEGKAAPLQNELPASLK